MSENLRVGVIGTGSIGRDHTRRITRVLTGARVVAVNDIAAESAAEVVDQLARGAQVFSTGEELIASPEVDAVVVTSWGATHEAFVLAALAAGKPCFCEKPLATEAEGAARIVAALASHHPEPQVRGPRTPRILGLGDARVNPERGDEVVD